MTSSTLTSNPFRKWGTLVMFLVVVVGVGMLIGIYASPGEWYAQLEKPPFNPPNWVFAPVWQFIYVCIAVAGWRIWQRAPKSRAMALWAVQMVLNWIWSPTFNTFELLWPAFAVIAVLWGAILAFILVARRIDGISSVLMVPYQAWISFAAILNLSIAILN